MRKIVAAIAVVLLWNACKSNNNKTLPIYGNRTPVTNVVDGKSETDTIYQTIPPFKFVNQYGDSISNKNVKDKIYVADFFFTSCPSICPIMQRNMLNVYNAFKADDDVKILSYTIDPKHDSVNVLKSYADKLNITGNSWWLLQGKKEETYQLAEKNYLVAVRPDSTVAGGIIHQGYFILVDKKSRLRGAYDGTKPEEVNKLIADIKTLKAETDEKAAK
ncbi:MAG TPA: SCO family protein [Mucilaginibacter sp.]|jgi:protein SCO1/2